ncbi:MAG TPA: energy transducer TonB [Azospirillum sp.]|nr:energy transducer TonB [Azospirillum sp.]
MGEEDRPGPALTRWGGSLAVVLGAHAMVAAAMLTGRMPVEAVPPPPGAVMIDLAPMPQVPPAAPQEASPEPRPAQPEPPPPALPREPAVESEPVPVPVPNPVVAPVPEPLAEPLPEPPPVEAEVALPDPPKPPPKPKEKPKPQPPRVERPKPAPAPGPTPPAAAAPTVPAPPAPVAAAPAPGPASTQVSRAVPAWQGLVLGHLERHKRYPRLAQIRRLEGVAQVRFILDRQGRVLSARLEKSSGHAILDEETVSLVERASPLPTPPPEMPQERIELVVPVQFFVR